MLVMMTMQNGIDLTLGYPLRKCNINISVISFQPSLVRVYPYPLSIKISKDYDVAKKYAQYKRVPGRAFLQTGASRLEIVFFASEAVITVMSMAHCTRHMALNTLTLIRVTVVTVRAHGNTHVICLEEQQYLLRFYLWLLLIMYTTYRNNKSIRLCCIKWFLIVLELYSGITDHVCFPA